MRDSGDFNVGSLLASGIWVNSFVGPGIVVLEVEFSVTNNRKCQHSTQIAAPDICARLPSQRRIPFNCL